MIQIVWPFNGNQPAIEDDEAVLFATIDGTHCRISEPRGNPSAKHFSHKFKGPGVAYEIVIHVRSQKILWVSGPYQAGMPDVEMPRQPDGILTKIPAGKKIIADKAYRGEANKLSTPNPHDSAVVSAYKGRARARHETVNKRIKDYQIAQQRFRHCIEKHKVAFEAVCILVQYDLENNNPLFEF
jgi:DDE superfamily endonuclease